MELDDMKERWIEMDRKLEATVRLNRQLMRESLLGRTEPAFRTLSIFVAMEVIITMPLLYLFGWFIATYIAEARFVLPALMLHLFVIAQLASSIHQLATVKSIDYSEPVVSIQKKVARLRLHRIAATKWTLIVAPLLWPPLFIVAVKGLFGFDPYVVFGPWIAANFAFGVAFVIAALWVAKRFGPRLSTSPLMQRVMDDLAGRSLMKATRALDEAREFENE